MACRFKGNTLMARALVNSMCYVRIYGPALPSGTNPDDPQLRNWLNENGYKKVEGWGGFKIEQIPFGHSEGSILVPYIDGTPQTGAIQDGDILIGHGPIKLNDINGFTELNPEDPHDDQVQLNDGTWVSEHDAWYLDYAYGPKRVLGYFKKTDCCIDSERRRVRRSDCAVTWDGKTMLKDSLVWLTAGVFEDSLATRSDCIELYDGTLALKRECVQVNLHSKYDIALKSSCVAIDGEWYLKTDPNKPPQSPYSHVSRFLDHLASL